MASRRVIITFRNGEKKFINHVVRVEKRSDHFVVVIDYKNQGNPREQLFMSGFIRDIRWTNDIEFTNGSRGRT